MDLFGFKRKKQQMDAAWAQFLEDEKALRWEFADALAEQIGDSVEKCQCGRLYRISKGRSCGCIVVDSTIDVTK